MRIPRLWVKTGSFALILIFPCAPLRSQSAKAALAPIPVAQRATLRARLSAYTEPFRKKDWGALYNLVSENRKNGLDGSLRVTRKKCVYDMQNTYDLRRGECVFVDWDYAEPPTSCSVLRADPKWKPQVPRKLEGTMPQVSREIFTCTL